MAKKPQAAQPAEDVSPFQETPEEPVAESGPASGRALRPEEQALAKAGAPTVPPSDEVKTPPKYGTPRKAGSDPAPRICHPLERAGDGLTRFKIRVARSSELQPTRYILAASEDEAVAFYLTFQKLDPADPNLQKVVTELPD